MIFVLGTIVAVINVINYSKADEYSDKVISVLVDNEGGFPQNFPMRPGMGNNGMTPETPFEARFFTVMLNDNGEVVFSDTKQIAAITPQTAEKYAKNLYANGETAGMYDDYKYRVKETDEGTLYIFLDCTHEMNSFRGFLQTSILISLGGLAVVFILIIIFSRIALKPVEESYQKQKHFITNASHDTERFRRNDFEPLDEYIKNDALAYIIKYIEKTGERIVYSKGLPQFFISDIMDDDIVCPIGLEDKKLLLFDNFVCWDEGEYIGEVSADVIKRMRKCN